MREALIKAGFAPIVTANPDDALRLLLDEDPQLVLLDLMLPGSDGIELMTKMLSLANLPSSSFPPSARKR